MRWGLFFLLLLLFAVLGYAAWIFYTQRQARRLGLPPPSWKSYIPFTHESATSYQGSTFPSPRRGGVMGWITDRFARLRNKRTHGGAYEDMETGGGAGRGRAGDHDEVWDARMGEGDTSYSHGGQQQPRGAYYEEQELGLAPGPPQPSSAKSPYHQYDGEGYAVKIDEPERGRSRSRGRVGDLSDESRSGGLENPFADTPDGSTLRSISPRPEPEAGNKPTARDFA